MSINEDNYMPIDGTVLINEVKKGLICKKEWELSKEKFPNRMLNISESPQDTAVLYLEHDEQSLALKKSLNQCIRDCNKAIERLGDRASDIFDVAHYLWSLKAKDNDEFVVINASEIAELLGYTKKKGGGFRIRDKKNIAGFMELLKLVQLKVDISIDFLGVGNSVEKKRLNIKSPALIISALVEETKTSNEKVTCMEYTWEYKPGKVISPLLDAPNKSFAYLDRKLIEMCPHKEKIEKRIGKAISWAFKMNSETKSLKFKVITLLNDALIEFNKTCPGKTFDVFEKSRVKLVEKGVLITFKYLEQSIKEMAESRDSGWVRKWLNSYVIITPPIGLKDMYRPMQTELIPSFHPESKRKNITPSFPSSESISFSPESALSQLTKLRDRYPLKELSLMLNTSASNLSMIVNGKRKISKKISVRVSEIFSKSS